MRLVTIAVLLAAPLTALAPPAKASELPGEAPATQQARFEKDVELKLDGSAAPALAVGAAPAPHSAAAQEDRDEEPRKKRKSTGDKVLTGAAVVLGIGALAVGGLLVALFVG